VDEKCGGVLCISWVDNMGLRMAACVDERKIVRMESVNDVIGASS